jgi:hypothetical protein
MPWEYVNPTTSASRDRIENKLYSKKENVVIAEGMELDIAMENMRDNETSRKWAIRQVHKLTNK